VNHYTIALDEPAVRQFIGFGEEQGICQKSDLPVFA
jgi:hypothetical protein